jgi:predicted ester cyclase
MGLPPSGKSFRFPCVFVYTVKDGLITHMLSVYDFTGWLLQIGTLKAKPV